jgi:DNA replication and repair protein RecF
MYLRHLGLVNFRNYRRLELDLSPHLSLFWGNNAQGKSNLLEAVYLLATSRSFRTSSERELVNWYADTEPVFARVVGDVVRHQVTTRLEVILAEAQPDKTGRGGLPPGSPPDEGGTEATAGLAPAASVRRRVRIGGQPRSVVDLLGHLNAVLFSPEDVELVAGPAELRRRYFDITLCQIDQRYLRTLRRYVRVLQQRNALLRQLRHRPPSPEQFDYWDSQLVDLGSELIVRRLRAIAYLNEQVAVLHPRLANDQRPLQLAYRATVPLDGMVLGTTTETNREADMAADATEVRRRFEAHLESSRPRERHLGVTLAGPHRDDAAFLAGTVDLRTYGSRGQQRTAALALKLAEIQLMEHYSGERPILLLDDVLSELDPLRRTYLQEVVQGQAQVLMTTTDPALLTPEFLRQAARHGVSEGSVTKEG